MWLRFYHPDNPFTMGALVRIAYALGQAEYRHFPAENLGHEQTMTGAFLRVKRDGEYQSIEVEYLTPAERLETFKQRRPEEIIRWLDMLCEEACKTEKMLNDLVKEGILELSDSGTEPAKQ